MMKMILSQKKQMQTEELEKMYEREMNIMTMKNRTEPQYLSQDKYSRSHGLGREFYGGEEGNLRKDDGEIKGESQFLFYQNQGRNKKVAENEEYSLRKALGERKKQLNRHPYYDIFKDMEENKSFNMDAQRLEEEQSTRRKSGMKNTPEQEDYPTGQKDTGFKFISNFNLKSNE